MSYDEMRAGPEMDALVAEMVMKWRRVWQDENGEHWEDAGGDGISSGPFLPRWSPSTDIAHAWEVVERMEAPAIKRQESDSFDDGEGGMAIPRSYLVSFEGAGGKRIEARGDTAPLAVCRAALKAVGQ